MLKIKLIVLVCCWMLAASAAAGPIATFADPVPRGGKANACSLDQLVVTHAPDHSVLSIVRNNGIFLETGNGLPERRRADCRLDIVLQRGSSADTTLRLDLRGTDFKDAQSELSYDVILGAQRHRVAYARGRVLDGSTPGGVMRFQLALPRGTRQIRLRIQGQARSLTGKDLAKVEIDTLDLCFLASPDAASCGTAAPEQ